MIRGVAGAKCALGVVSKVTKMIRGVAGAKAAASKVKKIRGITTAAKAYCCGKSVALVIKDRILQRKPRRANGCYPQVIRLITSLEEK